MSEVDPFSEENSAVDMGKVDKDSINDAGSGVCKTGKFHMQCTGVSLKLEPADSDDKRFIPEVHMNLRLEAGEHESELSKTMVHRIRLMNPIDWKNFAAGMESLSAKDLTQIAALLYGFGVVGEEIFGSRFVITKDMYERLDGCHAICEVSKRLGKADPETKERPVYFNIYSNNVWRCDHPEVKDVPKFADLLNTIIPDGNTDSDMDEI